MFKMQKDGSILLFVIIIISVLSFISLSFWHKSGMLLDLVLLKEKFYKNFYLTEAILNYGIFNAKNNFEKYLQSDKREDLSFLLDKLDKKDKLQAILLVKKSAERALYLCVTLKKDKKTLFKLSCNLVESVEPNERKKREFIVQNFTIGNPV